MQGFAVEADAGEVIRGKAKDRGRRRSETTAEGLEAMAEGLEETPDGLEEMPDGLKGKAKDGGRRRPKATAEAEGDDGGAGGDAGWPGCDDVVLGFITELRWK